MEALAPILLKVGAFLLLIFTCFKWGSISAKLKASNKDLKNVIKQSKNLEANNSTPYVDEPAMCLYDTSEDDPATLPEDAKEISNQIDRDV